MANCRTWGIDKRHCMMRFGIEKERILFEDSELLAYHKPAGLAVQSARMDVPDLESLLLTYQVEQDPSGPKPYLAVINRLDQPVEGIVLFAKNKKAAAALTAQLNDGRMQKQYLALCCMPVKQEEARAAEQGRVQEHSDSVQSLQKSLPVHIEHYLKKDARTNTSAVVAKGTPGAKQALLELTQVTAWSSHLSLARIHLITGRHHQIRVQMAAVNMPLLGDRKYNPDWEKYVDEYFGQRRTLDEHVAQRKDRFPGQTNESRNVPLCLCAYSLDLLHPRTKRKIHLEATPEFVGRFS